MLPPHAVGRPSARTGPWKLARLRDAESRADGTPEGTGTGIVEGRVASPSTPKRDRREDPGSDRLSAESDPLAMRKTERDG